MEIANAIAAIKAALGPEDVITYAGVDEFIAGHIDVWKGSENPDIQRYRAVLDALMRDEFHGAKTVVVYDPEFCSSPEVEEAIEHLEEVAKWHQWFYLLPRNLGVRDAAFWVQIPDTTERLYRMVPEEGLAVFYVWATY